MLDTHGAFHLPADVAFFNTPSTNPLNWTDIRKLRI